MRAQRVLELGLTRRIQLTLPIPPSKNRLTRRLSTGGGGWREFPSPEKLRFLRDVKLIGCRHHPLRGPVSVALVVYLGLTRAGRQQHCDLQNYEELLYDALQGVAYVNDSQIKRHRSEERRDNARPRVEVTVEELR